MGSGLDGCVWGVGDWGVLSWGWRSVQASKWGEGMLVLEV